MSDESDVDPNEAWDTAKKYAALLGAVPSSFSTLIRSLIGDEDKNNGQLSSSTCSAAVRLFSGPSSRAALYFASRLYRPTAFQSDTAFKVKDLVLLYRPIDLAGLVGCLYLFRRARKRCPDDEWGELAQGMKLGVDLGFLVGTAIPNIGAALGALRGGVRSAAIATFHIHDQKGAKEYRRHLASKNLEFDQDWEVSRWGCSSAQVSSVMVQSLGFGVTFSNALYMSLTLSEAPLASGPLSGCDLLAYRFAITQLWAKAVYETGSEPTIVHRGEFYPVRTALEELVAQVSKIKSGAAEENWLSRGKDDLTAQNAPHMFVGEVEETGEEIE